MGNFVIIVPGYKTSEWVEKNIQSILDQTYTNYRVIFIDDCSPDDSFEKASKILDGNDKRSKFTLIKNTERVGALQNLYDTINSCADDDIIITLDGDDWFANQNVLDKLASTYKDPNVWLTYGQFICYPDNGAGCSSKIPPEIIKQNSIRSYRWCTSHLRSFYAWLFKKINKADLIDKNGKFYAVTWDLAMMYPMVEMAGEHSIFIPDILYVYNRGNPLNDMKVHTQLQQKLDREIRAKRKYNKL